MRGRRDRPGHGAVPAGRLAPFVGHRPGPALGWLFTVGAGELTGGLPGAHRDRCCGAGESPRYRASDVQAAPPTRSPPADSRLAWATSHTPSVWPSRVRVAT